MRPSAPPPCWRRRAAVCEARSYSEPRDAVDLRAECLENRRRAFDQVVDVLADANPHRVRNAVALVSGLPSLWRCDDVDAPASASVPTDEQLAVTRSAPRAHDLATPDVGAETPTRIGRIHLRRRRQPARPRDQVDRGASGPRGFECAVGSVAGLAPVL